MMELKDFILMNIKMQGLESYIKVNGIRRLGIEMELEFNFGQMVLSMKVCGKEIRLMVKEE